jgi:hypothetical protein
MQTVYAITRNSGWIPLCVFDTSEDAQAHLTQLGPGHEVRELVLYAPGEHPRLVTVYEHFGSVNPQGTVDREEERAFEDWDYTVPADRPSVREWEEWEELPGSCIRVRGLRQQVVDGVYRKRVAEIQAQKSKGIPRTGR